MSYYVVFIPGREPFTTGNIRRFTDLPEGTAIECFTDSDSWPIPVKDGKPVFGRWRAKHRARRIY